MFKKSLLALAAATLAVPASMAVPTAAVSAHPPRWAPAHGYRHHRVERREARRYYTTGNGIRYWRGSRGEYYCRRPNGTTGLIVGAAAGALAGRAIDTRGERATGTILGGVVGALLGRQIERGTVRCR
jgi:hypothetical protein